jgi:hypothetical protein
LEKIINLRKDLPGIKKLQKAWEHQLDFYNDYNV